MKKFLVLLLLFAFVATPVFAQVNYSTPAPLNHISSNSVSITTAGDTGGVSFSTNAQRVFVMTTDTNTVTMELAHGKDRSADTSSIELPEDEWVDIQTLDISGINFFVTHDSFSDDAEAVIRVQAYNGL